MVWETYELRDKPLNPVKSKHSVYLFIAYPQRINVINRDQNAKCLKVEIPMLVMPSKQIKLLACVKRVSELLKAKVAVRAENAWYACLNIAQLWMELLFGYPTLIHWKALAKSVSDSLQVWWTGADLLKVLKCWTLLFGILLEYFLCVVTLGQEQLKEEPGTGELEQSVKPQWRPYA